MLVLESRPVSSPDQGSGRAHCSEPQPGGQGAAFRNHFNKPVLQVCYKRNTENISDKRSESYAKKWLRLISRVILNNVSVIERPRKMTRRRRHGFLVLFFTHPLRRPVPAGWLRRGEGRRRTPTPWVARSTYWILRETRATGLTSPSPKSPNSVQITQFGPKNF